MIEHLWRKPKTERGGENNLQNFIFKACFRQKAVLSKLGLKKNWRSVVSAKQSFLLKPNDKIDIFRLQWRVLQPVLGHPWDLDARTRKKRLWWFRKKCRNTPILRCFWSLISCWTSQKDFQFKTGKKLSRSFFANITCFVLGNSWIRCKKIGKIVPCKNLSWSLLGCILYLRLLLNFLIRLLLGFSWRLGMWRGQKLRGNSK